ncbi:class I SAM-dependent methyltransferase [Vibrio maritimus]|uniref:class I SAM-dependent methyltransferase n=1 Tax=Vibrio maritimus TaxID=990268 RepID=UPI001F2F1806|nr:class I SAM-dependent methyltransferase [Vibrio maritimus]
MSDEYNDQVSKHYAAYRPPIHGLILKQAIESIKPSFEKGLDIGCGTGLSSNALAAFCCEVVGIDPSAEMLANASLSHGVSFVQGTGDNLPLTDSSVDIVTFAGSLSYAKSDKLVDEILRVGNEDVTVVAYDFEVLLDDVLTSLGITLPPSTSSYNHAENFSEFEVLTEIAVHQSRLVIPVSSEQLAHVLFSSSKRFALLVERFGSDNTFDRVVKALSEDRHQEISVDTYYSTYRPN